MGSKAVQKLVVVRKTEKLGERERKALFPSEGKGHDDDDEHYRSRRESLDNGQHRFKPTKFLNLIAPNPCEVL